MAKNIADDDHPFAQNQRVWPIDRLLPPLLFFASIFIGADWVVIEVSPLSYLGIAYPKWLDYANFVIPGSCAVLWLAGLRRWPRTSVIVPVLLCWILMPAIPLYAMSLSIHLPVARSLTFEELDRFKKTYQVPIVSRGSKDGEEVLVAPINAQKAKEFLYEIGILRGKMTSVYRSVGL